MTERFVRLASHLPPLPEELLLARDRGEVLFIAGSGVSKPEPANLPDFRGLAVEVYKQLDVTMATRLEELMVAEERQADWRNHIHGLTADQQAELKRFQDREYDVVLGMLERRLDGVADRTSSVRKAISICIDAAKEPTKLHHALVSLGQRTGDILLVTTNFDRLLELAARRQRRRATTLALASIRQPSRRSDFAGILHLHGVLGVGKEPASDLIVTDQDFGEAYLRRRWAADFIYDAARIFKIVLVGYTANDAPMRYLLNAIAGDDIRFPDLKRRYAFVPVQEDDPRELADWRARGITPIPYSSSNGHAQLRETLETWAESIPAPANYSPTPEGNELWDAIARRGTPTYETMRLIGERMAEQVHESNLSSETRARLAERVVFRVLHDRETPEHASNPALPDTIVQQMLRLGEDRARATCAHVIGSFLETYENDRSSPEERFRASVSPFLNNVWPKELSLRSRSLSDAFAGVPAKAGAAFAEAVDAIARFLTPFDCWALWAFGVCGADASEDNFVVVRTPNDAAAFLKLLDLCVGTGENAVVPHDLERGLNHIKSLNPLLANDSRFQRLAAQIRR